MKTTVYGHTIGYTAHWIPLHLGIGLSRSNNADPMATPFCRPYMVMHEEW